MIGFNALMSRQTLKLREQEVLIYVIDNAQDQHSQIVVDKLNNTPRLQVMQSVESYEQLFNEKVLQAVVTLEGVELSDGYSYLNAIITYNRVDERSELAYNVVSSLLRNLEKDLIGSRLQAINISEDILKVIEITAEDQATEQQTLGMILARILPYFLILISISGSAVAAVDLVAGEKERGTLETILVSAARRNELVLGKFAAVISISLLTVLLNLASIFFSFQHIISQAAVEAGAIQIPFGSLFLILILMAPMIIFFAAIVFSLSTYSRNMKESYSYTQPLMIVAMLLSLISALPAIDTTFGMTLIPVINVSLMIKEIMLGDLNVFFYLSTLISTCILVILSVLFSISLFYKEEVLFRTTEESLVKGGKKGGWNILSPGFAMLFFGLILLLFYYVGLSWQIKDLEQGLIKTQIFLILLPVLLVIRLGKQDPKEVLSVKGTKPLNYLAVLLATLPLFVLVNLVAQIINIIYPFPEHYLESFQQLFFLDGKSIWYALFLIAILPGIAEEVMFRGYFIKAFQQKGAWKSILISGLLFAALHLDLFRFLPVAILGIWLGYILLRTGSIIIPILAHITNNALAVLIARYGEHIPGIHYIIKDDLIAWWTAIPSLILFLIILQWFNKLNDPLIDSEQQKSYTIKNT